MPYQHINNDGCSQTHCWQMAFMHICLHIDYTCNVTHCVFVKCTSLKKFELRFIGNYETHAFEILHMLFFYENQHNDFFFWKNLQKWGTSLRNPMNIYGPVYTPRRDQRFIETNSIQTVLTQVTPIFYIPKIIRIEKSISMG